MDRVPPEGFQPHPRKSPVTEPWEPLFSREHDLVLQLGAFIRPPLCNSRRLVHGGVIAALADNAMGISYVMAWRAAFGEGGGALTASLAVDYIGAGEEGRWLLVTPRMVHAGRRSGVTDAIVTADGVVIARASATFRMRA